MEEWFRKWRFKVNENKSTHITFTLRRQNCPPVTNNNSKIPTKDSVKYLGLHLDRRLTWKEHIKAKGNQLKLIVKQYYWLLGRRTNLCLKNKLLLYKVILKPIWTYGILLWGTAIPISKYSNASNPKQQV